MKKSKNHKHQDQGEFLADVNSQITLFETVYRLGIGVLQKMIDDEIAEICGERYKHIADRIRTRWGKTESEVIFGSRKISIPHSRVRNIANGREESLATVQSARQTDLLQEHQTEQMVIGVSTRKYRRSLESKSERIKARGTSKSAVLQTTGGQIRRLHCFCFLSRYWYYSKHKYIGTIKL